MTDFKVGDRIEQRHDCFCPRCSCMEGVIAEVSESNGVPIYRVDWDPTWWVTADDIQLYEEPNGN